MENALQPEGAVESTSGEVIITVIGSDAPTKPAKLCSGFGQFHSDQTKALATITYPDIQRLVDNPPQVEKSKAQWVIPSNLLTRKFKEQKDEGRFYLLWADLDQQPPPLDNLKSTIEKIFPKCDYEIYTTSSATKDNQKSRIIIPLEIPLCGSDWGICQRLFNDKLVAEGVTPDRANQRAAQLCYLPNRGAFYDTRSNRGGVFFDPTQWRADIQAINAEEQRSAEEKAREEKARRLKREARRSQGYSVIKLIEAFNEDYSVEEILWGAGYDQDPNNPEQFRHPNSESGSFSASVKNGRVNSLSPNDPLFSDGKGAHDAFSAFTVLEHNGDDGEARRAAGELVKVDGMTWHFWDAVRDMPYYPDQLDGEAANDGSDPTMGWGHLTALTEEALKAAQPPKTIVENYLHSDVGVLFAAGGVGKTTLVLYEAAHIALGLPLWGLKVISPGPVVIVTGEDSDQQLFIRFREILGALNLTPEQRKIAIDNVSIHDVTKSESRPRLTQVINDGVQRHKSVDGLIYSLRAVNPVLVVFDPLVSFGIGESRVNDAEQALIEAARWINRKLDCCVRLIHHTGKQNARSKIVDQYAGRGGSALPDGSRMNHVMLPLGGDEWLKETGQCLPIDHYGLLLARPKMSHCPPQGNLYIRRHRFSFTHCVVTAQDREEIKKEQAQQDASQVLVFIKEELENGTKHTRNSLDGTKLAGLSREKIRNGVDALLSSGQIEEVDFPPEQRQGRRQKYLAPVSH